MIFVSSESSKVVASWEVDIMSFLTISELVKLMIIVHSDDSIKLNLSY